MPPIGTMISRWYAQREKTSASAMWTCGNQIGGLVAFPIGSLFCPLTHILGGWPLMFYFCGIMGTLWLIAFTVFATNSPQKNRFVSEQEKRYLNMESNRFQFESRKVCCFCDRSSVACRPPHPPRPGERYSRRQPCGQTSTAALRRR